MHALYSTVSTAMQMRGVGGTPPPLEKGGDVPLPRILGAVPSRIFTPNISQRWGGRHFFASIVNLSNP